MWNIFRYYFLFFIFYSFLGWLMEVILIFFQDKKLVNRGFFIGPYCPIYGFGAILITYLLHYFIFSPILLFIFSVIICSLLEYSTSYILEKIFHARWWDYSHNKYNLNGRICLNTMIPFGLLGIIMVYFINPNILKIYNNFDNGVLNVITIIILIIVLADFIISITILIKIRKDSHLLAKDNTEEMSKKVIEKIKGYGILFKRIFMAFPNFRFKHIRRVIKEKTVNAKNKINNYVRKGNKNGKKDKK